MPSDAITYRYQPPAPPSARALIIAHAIEREAFVGQDGYEPFTEPFLADLARVIDGMLARTAGKPQHVLDQIVAERRW